MTFRTNPKPPTVISYQLTLLPRSLPNTSENVQRATNLFMAFQEFAASDQAIKELGLSWHVAPESGEVGRRRTEEWGTKVEVVGQFVGSEDEFETVMGMFERVLKEKGEMEFERDHTVLSESGSAFSSMCRYTKGH
jgi:hypothetical protein